MARDDWAVYGFVRAGIEARARLERVAEERVQLRLHTQRIVRWVQRRLEILMEVLDEPEAKLFNIKTIIIHHYRVIKCLLKANSPLLKPDERALLLTLQRRIVESLDPENITVTEIVAERDDELGNHGMNHLARNQGLGENGINPVDSDDDADSVQSNEDGINRELNEEELGGFIAHRLQEEVDAELIDRFREEIDEELGLYEQDGDENLGMFEGDGEEIPEYHDDEVNQDGMLHYH
jgi:hypothetical protein